MIHQVPSTGVSAADIERAMDRLAREIVAFGPKGRTLLPLYERLERELAAIKAADDCMARVLAEVGRKQ